MDPARAAAALKTAAGAVATSRSLPAPPSPDPALGSGVFAVLPRALGAPGFQLRAIRHRNIEV